MGDTPTRTQRPRSPKAPKLDLKSAIDKARIFYEKEPSLSAPAEIVLKHIGYTPNSGTGLVVLASLRGFGLVEDHDNNEVALSELALDIIRDERPESSERDVAIRRAALLPTVHVRVFDHFGGTIPSDEKLRYYLRKNLGFTDNGGDHFINQFRATLAFAGIVNGVKLAGSESEEKKDSHGSSALSATMFQKPKPPQPPKTDALAERPTMNQDTFTLDEGQVVLQWPASISPESYKDLEDWLKLMERRIKRAVVTEIPDEEAESE